MPQGGWSTYVNPNGDDGSESSSRNQQQRRQRHYDTQGSGQYQALGQGRQGQPSRGYHVDHRSAYVVENQYLLSTGGGRDWRDSVYSASSMVSQQKFVVISGELGAQ